MSTNQSSVRAVENNERVEECKNKCMVSEKLEQARQADIEKKQEAAGCKRQVKSDVLTEMPAFLECKKTVQLQFVSLTI